MKRRSHIVIDECVTGSYHRNTLEGLAAGCVVVNGVGVLAGVEPVFRRCAGDADSVPCTFATLDTLEGALTSLVDKGAAALEADGRASRAWMERHWDFGAQWERVWRPAVEAAIERRSGKPRVAATGSPCPSWSTLAGSARARRFAAAAAASRAGVVARSGRPWSCRTAASSGCRTWRPRSRSLRQQDGVGEIIVSEMGAEPVASAVARDGADKHVFIQGAGPFERGRALNAGSGLADCPFVLWHDNDLVAGPGFVTRAIAELRERRLDYLVPYTSVHYLSEPDAAAVMDGRRDAGDCTPVRVLYSGRRAPGCSGGAGLVARSFLEQHGGLIEGFKGWGGEDNAWNVKVRLLGRAGPTRRLDQRLYHLFHPGSAGYPGQTPAAANPHYQDNVAALLRVQAIRSARQFLDRFPAPPAQSCAWDAARGLFTSPARRSRASPRRHLHLGVTV